VCDRGYVCIDILCLYRDYFIVCKLILSFLCFQISNPTMQALAQDHLNDVFSNIVAVVCGIIGKNKPIFYLIS